MNGPQRPAGHNCVASAGRHGQTAADGRRPRPGRSRRDRSARAERRRRAAAPTARRRCRDRHRGRAQHRRPVHRPRIPAVDNGPGGLHAGDGGRMGRRGRPGLGCAHLVRAGRGRRGYGRVPRLGRPAARCSRHLRGRVRPRAVGARARGDDPGLGTAAQMGVRARAGRPRTGPGPVERQRRELAVAAGCVEGRLPRVHHRPGTAGPPRRGHRRLGRDRPRRRGRLPRRPLAGRPEVGVDRTRRVGVGAAALARSGPPRRGRRGGPRVH